MAPTAGTRADAPVFSVATELDGQDEPEQLDDDEPPEEPEPPDDDEPEELPVW